MMHEFELVMFCVSGNGWTHYLIIIIVTIFSSALPLFR